MPTFKRKTDLTKSLFTVQEGKTERVKILGDVFRFPLPSIARSEDGCVPCVDIIDLNTGEEFVLIVPTILERLLADREPDEYPCYEIENRGKHPAKNYNMLKVWELEEE